MKSIKPKLVLIFVLLFAFLTLPAFAEMKNEPKGYGGYKWNASSKNFFGKYRKGLIMFNDAGNFEIFKNKNESKTLEGAKWIETEDVIYYFNKSDGFGAVTIDFRTTKDNFNKLLKSCVNKWGKPDYLDYIDGKQKGWLAPDGQAAWQGKKTFVKIKGDSYTDKDKKEVVKGDMIIALKEYDGHIWW